jgi:hypothetical protein
MEKVFSFTCFKIIDGKFCGKVHSDKDRQQAIVNMEQCDHITHTDSIDRMAKISEDAGIYDKFIPFESDNSK